MKKLTLSLSIAIAVCLCAGSQAQAQKNADETVPVFLDGLLSEAKDNKVTICISNPAYRAVPTPSAPGIVMQEYAGCTIWICYSNGDCNEFSIPKKVVFNETACSRYCWLTYRL